MGNHSEGVSAKTIERQTAKIPPDVYLWTAVAAMVTSLTLKICKQEHRHFLSGSG
ncbi:hypothetical protein LQ567_03565 [Niabella pedocola]|uniref:Uncharacterized protein n=1 Tax=Niabella pedocola TaxID=1752077 RepID=A0ABS8PL46_9BACT|nr:hypothetical protein [Niabella pedocola]MCD2421824.1 hypothetical protein [Niabella pedocola]